MEDLKCIEKIENLLYGQDIFESKCRSLNEYYIYVEASVPS